MCLQRKNNTFTQQGGGPGTNFAENKFEKVRFKLGSPSAFLEHVRQYKNYIDLGGNRTFKSFCEPPAIVLFAKLAGVADSDGCGLTNHELVTQMRAGLDKYYLDKFAKEVESKAKKAAATEKKANKKRKSEDI